MRKIVFLINFLLFLLNGNFLYAQEKTDFTPSGKVIARSFFDYSTSFNKNDSGFDITRAFLGYGYKFSPTLQGQVIIDGASGKDASGKLQTYMRNAFINWKDKGFDIHVGLIGLLQFSMQEDYWKHRYILKSFQDLNSMAPSVDIGFTTQYEINPTLSVDFSLTNGEGYKKIKSDNTMRYALGVSFKPLKNAIIRVYGDYYNKSEDTLSTAKRNDQKTLSLFTGYENERISLGLEYNRVFDKDFTEGQDFYGYSFYTSVKLASQWRSFARYDWADSTNPKGAPTSWSDKDGQLIMVGVEFQPFKQIKIAPNFRNINPEGGESEQYFFINAEFEL